MPPPEINHHYHHHQNFHMLMNNEPNEAEIVRFQQRVLSHIPLSNIIIHNHYVLNHQPPIRNENPHGLLIEIVHTHHYANLHYYYYLEMENLDRNLLFGNQRNLVCRNHEPLLPHLALIENEFTSQPPAVLHIHSHFQNHFDFFYFGGPRSISDEDEEESNSDEDGNKSNSDEDEMNDNDDDA